MMAKGYKTFFMLISAEHAIYPAYKYQNNQNDGISRFKSPFIFLIKCSFSIDEQDKFHA